MPNLNQVQSGHTLTLYDFTREREIVRREGVPDGEVSTVFHGLCDCANTRQLLFCAVILDGRKFYDRQEFVDMVHSVNEFSTYHGGTQVF